MGKILKFKDEMSRKDSKRRVKSPKRRQVPNLKHDSHDSFRHTRIMGLSFRENY